MRKAAYIAVAVIAVVIGLALAVPLLLDLNDYKAEIAESVAAATGRELTLEGDIDSEPSSGADIVGHGHYPCQYRRRAPAQTRGDKRTRSAGCAAAAVEPPSSS